MKEKRSGNGSSNIEFNPEWLRSTERVVRLIESIFHCKVEFSSLSRFLDELATGLFHSDQLAFLESTHLTATRFVRGIEPGVCAIPLRVRSELNRAPLIVGMALVSGLAAHSDERVEQLAEFLQLAIEARIDAFERLLDIERFEAQINQQKQRSALFADREVLGTGQTDEELTLTSEDPSLQNVISFIPLREMASDLRRRDASENTFGELGVELEEGEELGINENRFDLDLGASPANGIAIHRPLLLFSRDPRFPVHKVALEIFDKSNLWNFVNINDLDPDTLASPGAFEAMGPTCIFVPDITLLKPEQQIRLAEIYLSERSDLPGLIIGAQQDPNDLLTRGEVLQHFLSAISVVDLCPRNVDFDAPIRYRMRVAVERVEAQIRFDAPDLTAQLGRVIAMKGAIKEDGSSFH